MSDRALLIKLTENVGMVIQAVNGLTDAVETNTEAMMAVGATVNEIKASAAGAAKERSS